MKPKSYSDFCDCHNQLIIRLPYCFWAICLAAKDCCSMFDRRKTIPCIDCCRPNPKITTPLPRPELHEQLRVCNRITYIHATLPIGRGEGKAVFHASPRMGGVAAKQS